MFERNYLSRMIRYNTQDAYWGRTPDNGSAKAASRIGRLRDSKRPRKLTEHQGRQVRQEPGIIELCRIRDHIRAQIVSEYGFIKMAEGEPIHEEYQTLGRTINGAIRAEERALLKRIQEEYDTAAPITDIQRQLNGELLSDNDASNSVFQFKFVERHRIAEALLCDLSSADQRRFHRHLDLFTDMIALCKRRERQRPRTRSVRMEDDDHAVNLPKLDPEEKHEIPLKCIGWQCLFCLTRDDLSLKDRQQKYKSKYSLQRHANRCRLNHFKPEEKMPCPDDHGCGVILESIMHFKSHAERVHDFCL